MRRAACFSLFAFASLISIPAVAQSWGARLVRVLDKVGRADLVADSSGRVHASAILPHGVSAKSLGLVPFDVDTASLRGTPAEIIAFGEQHPEVEISVGPPLRPLLDKSKAWTHAADFVNQTGFNGTGVVVGVIDTGIDILHPDFRDKNGKTRIKWLLQTGIPSVGKHADMEAKYCEFLKTTCAVFDADQIDALITEAEATGADPPNTGGTYDSSGHGTHVASIAAGNGGVMKGTPKYVGVAPGADLVIAAPQSFQDDDVGWAAQFIFDRADDMKEPCSVNVSLGSDYGAHDGSDILDRRLSRFVGDDRPGHAITVAAGNSGGLYLFPKEDTPWGIHTETTVYPDTDVRVPIYAPVANAGRGYLWVTFDRGDNVSVALEGPGGQMWVGSVAPGQEASFSDGKNSAGVVNNEFKPDAALVPVTNGAVLVWSGAWKENSEFALHLSGRGHAQMWLTSTGDLDQTIGLLFKRAIRQGTINVPASSPSLLAVGCTLNRLSWPTVNGPSKPVQLAEFGGDDHPELDSVCYFGSSGPTPAGVPKPEIAAPGGFIVGAMARTADPRKIAGGLFDEGGCPDGVPNCYLADNTHGVAVGTSMSSPQVAGAIALLFQKNRSLTQAQVTSVIQAGAAYPQGKVPNPVQLGPGELDLLGALRTLDAEQDMFGDPDATKSWYVLSSAYARPDPTWPVWGTIELRRADGTVAHALDGTFLTLDVQNGIVVQPLTKIRHGLYRFSIAGKDGHGGESMTIDVKYKGQSLGASTLPIQSDVWTQRNPIDAVGGCTITRAADRGGSGARAFALSALTLALALSARRRRARS